MVGRGSVTAETHPEFDFLMAQAIWFDILACVSMDRVPRIPYREWLEASDLEMADLMGCYNWIMVCIGDLAYLQAWKTEMEEQGTLSMMALATKSSVIQGALQEGAHGLGLATKVSTRMGPRKPMTPIFIFDREVLTSGSFFPVKPHHCPG
jgi:hypothetical protein